MMAERGGGEWGVKFGYVGGRGEGREWGGKGYRDKAMGPAKPGNPEHNLSCPQEPAQTPPTKGNLHEKEKERRKRRTESASECVAMDMSLKADPASHWWTWGKGERGALL